MLFFLTISSAIVSVFILRNIPSGTMSLTMRDENRVSLLHDVLTLSFPVGAKRKNNFSSALETGFFVS